MNKNNRTQQNSIFGFMKGSITIKEEINELIQEKWDAETVQIYPATPTQESFPRKREPRKRIKQK